MIKMVSRMCIMMALLLMQLSAVAENCHEYLTKPTGYFGVGYQDYHWIDEHNCPGDAQYSGFYNGHNAGDFSKDNAKFCRELMVRVYFPSDQTVTTCQQASAYYPPLIKKYQEGIEAANIPDISQESIDAMSRIKSYAHSRPGNHLIKKHPVIFFLPGLSDVAQNYTNIITSLVSHSYIVIAVNATFVGGPIAFPDGHVVASIADDPNITPDQLKAAVHSDFNFVYYHSKQLSTSDPLFSMMDWSRTGLLGHSMGAVMSVIFSHEHPSWFKGAVAMAAPANPNDYHAFQGFDIPFMHIHDAFWPLMYDSKPPGKFELKDHNYLVKITPNPLDFLYTRHNNFSDFSTLQYQSAIQGFQNYSIHHGSAGLQLGHADGYQVSKVVNKYLLEFFNQVLNQKESPVFNDCIPLNDTEIQCGENAI